MFAWKGETLEEYWECTLNAITWPSDDGKGDGPDLIVDDGGDMTLYVCVSLRVKMCVCLFVLTGACAHKPIHSHTTHTHPHRLVHEGYKAEELYAKDGTLPDPNSTDNAEFRIVLQLIARELPKNPKKWTNVANRMFG